MAPSGSEMDRLIRWLLLWPALLALLAGWLYEPLTPRYRALEAAARRGDAAALAAGVRAWFRTGAYLPASREVRDWRRAGGDHHAPAAAAGDRPPVGKTPPRPAPGQ